MVFVVEVVLVLLSGWAMVLLLLLVRVYYLCYVVLLV